jgi:hypothetical protein
MRPGITLLLIRLGSGTLRFLGQPTCPDGAAVEKQLRQLDPRLLESETKRLVQLERRPEGLRVLLLNTGGEPLEDRLLSGKRSCDDWARVVASLLATWEMELDGPATKIAAASMPPAEAPLKPVLPGTTPSEPVVVDPSAEQWQGEIGIGVSGSLASDGSAAMGWSLLTTLAPPARPYGGLLTFTGTMLRALPLGSGTAKWQIFTAGLGGYGAMGSKNVKLQLGAEFFAGLLNTLGEGYQTSSNHQAFDPGIGIFGRFVWSFARSWSMWGELGASFWPTRQEVQVVTGPTTSTSAPLPPVDFGLTIGLGLAGGL